jgi:hypothetical protein
LHFSGPGLSSAAKPDKVSPFYWEIYAMQDRRRNARDKVIYGGVAEVGERGAARDCVVRNISENGAGIEFSNVVKLPKEQMSLVIARKGRSFLARIIWWRDNFVGVAFSDEKPSELPDSDLGERLRRSEKKKRQLQRRINELLGG